MSSSWLPEGKKAAIYFTFDDIQPDTDLPRAIPPGYTQEVLLLVHDGKKFTMKIAVITEDGQTISQHFGRAPYYQVFTIEDGKISGTEMRDKVGHQHFVNEPHHHDHDHDHEHDARGHGFGAQADAKHMRMIESITDCEVVIVRGMGRGAYLAMEQANIRPFVTDIASAEEAVKAYIGGTLVDHTERLH